MCVTCTLIVFLDFFGKAVPPHCNPHDTLTFRGQRKWEKTYGERTVGRGLGWEETQLRRVAEGPRVLGHAPVPWGGGCL